MQIPYGVVWSGPNSNLSEYEASEKKKFPSTPLAVLQE